MAIADRLNKLRTDIEDTYQAITEIGGTIPSNKNTNNIPEAIRSVYDNLPKVSDTGTNVSLSPTLKGRLGIVAKGNTLQDGEPTPETPVDIQSATGTQKVVVSGKNLFDGEYQNAIVGSDGKYNTNNSTRTAMIKIEPNTTYFIKKYENTGIGTRLGIVESSTQLSSGESGTPIYYNETATEYSYTSGANAYYLYVYVTNNITNIPYLMVSKGNTATPYQPYQEPQEVDIELSSRNLFDKTNGIDNGHFIQASSGNLSNASGSGALDTYACTFPIPVKPNTTYIKSGTIGAGTTRFEDANHNNIGWGSYQTSFTTPANCHYVLFNLLRTNAPYSNVQLEKGSTATDYTPYYNYTPNKIDIYEDYIDGTPDNWVLYKKTRKLELAIADMNNNDNYPGWGSVPYLHNDYPSRNDPSFPADLITNIGGDKSKIGLNTNGVNSLLFLNKGSWGKTQTQWKEQYPNLVFELVYGLQEHEPTPITEENLISQLNELYYLQSYNDTTNIDVTGNLPMRITASAIKGE